jgi:AMP deaminase
MFSERTVEPDLWTSNDNPPYAFYLYFMYANIKELNLLRSARGLNTFNFRPHSGEAGSVNHLAVSFLLAENISHGIRLEKSATLQYLFYLCQIGVALSPSSNDAIYLPHFKNPVNDFHKCGLNISLSSDSALQFHMTQVTSI